MSDTRRRCHKCGFTFPVTEYYKRTHGDNVMAVRSIVQTFLTIDEKQDTTLLNQKLEVIYDKLYYYVRKH
jgi:transposase-like protein